MILTQEELNQKFPLDVVALPEKRYCVAWYVEGVREVVLVYDRFHTKIVYKGSSKSRKDHYGYIQKFYGKSNCNPPKEINPDFYKDL